MAADVLTDACDTRVFLVDLTGMTCIVVTTGSFSLGSVTVESAMLAEPNLAQSAGQCTCKQFFLPTSSGTGETGVFLIGLTGVASALATPGRSGGFGTTASQTASRGNPSAPKTKKRPRQPRVDSSSGDRKSPTRFPAQMVSELTAVVLIPVAKNGTSQWCYP